MAPEAQPNKALSGKELRNLMVKDFSDMLDQDTMLASHIAYRQVAYSISSKIMLSNPIIPDWTNKVKSKKSTANQVEESEALTAVEAFPLKRTADDEPVNIGVERTRQIVSPNQSRIENELPVPITRRTPDGDSVEDSVVYEKASLPDDGGFPDGVTERMLTDEEIERAD